MYIKSKHRFPKLKTYAIIMTIYSRYNLTTFSTHNYTLFNNSSSFIFIKKNCAFNMIVIDSHSHRIILTNV